ncbi:MAG: DMT family transporter [Clostridia bacterium]|nr:DMT family transporter [Clostridia bacterium]
MKKENTAVFFAIFAAALYAVNVPFSKLLLLHVQPTMLAGFLYLGAGIGVGIMLGMRFAFVKERKEKWLTKKDMPFTIAMVVLDIVAPIFLMYGIKNTSSANVSLLNNFEIVATSIIALVIFKEKITKRLWFAIFLVILASIVLGFEVNGSIQFDVGSLFVLLACVCWGFENNCTRRISEKSPEEIVVIKGVFSGIGSTTVAFLIGEHMPKLFYIGLVMLLGFVSYGLSIKFYITAQKSLGAAKTSAFYSIAPFLGVGFSFLILKERPLLQFYFALLVMIIATILMIIDSKDSDC